MIKIILKGAVEVFVMLLGSGFVLALMLPYLEEMEDVTQLFVIILILLLKTVVALRQFRYRVVQLRTTGKRGRSGDMKGVVKGVGPSK